jgi:NADPH-dependent 7-cyano-7-deazaguanine reductase QueF
MLFNTLRDSGVGLSYPSASNEKLVDFNFDEFKVSSKGGGGGTPSGDTIVQLIYNAYKSGQLHFTDMDEQDFLNNFLLKWVNPNKFDSKSNTFNNVITLANTHLFNNKKSGYSYFLNVAKIQPLYVSRENILGFLDKLSENENSFIDFLSTLFTSTGFSTSKSDIKKYYIDYIDKKEANNSDRIGYVFYPIMVEISNELNTKYQDILTRFAQKVTEIKQVYLDIYVSKGIFKFTCKPFKQATFSFEQKGSTNNPFNANIGIKIKK